MIWNFRRLSPARTAGDDNAKSYMLRGILALAFGTIALLLPATAVFALVIVFGAYAFTDGFFALISAASHDARFSTWALVIEGAAGVLVGMLIFLAPQLSVVALAYVVAIWALLIGASKISNAIRLRKEIRGEGLIMLSGLASILLGILLLAMPIFGMLAVVSVLGIYGIVAGGLLLALAVRLRRLEHDREALRDRAA